jgi:hypothetical protein
MSRDGILGIFGVIWFILGAMSLTQVCDNIPIQNSIMIWDGLIIMGMGILWMHRAIRGGDTGKDVRMR